MYGPGGANPYGVSTPATTVPPTHVEILGRRTANDLRGHSIQAVAAASERFFSDFPNGEFALMDTDSVYEAAGRRHILMCGFFAIINSFQDLKRYDKRVRVPKFEELLDVLENEAAARFMEYGMLDIPYNRFSYDELCVILDEWVKKYWPSCPWGGVRLGVVSPVAPSQLRIPVPNHPNAAKKKLLAPQLPISDPAPTGLPDLVVWIANLSGDHWEGMAKVTQEREKQVLPQTGHDPHAMQSPNHLFQQGQFALPGREIQSQQCYSQQPPTAAPNIGWNALGPWSQGQSVPSPNLGGSQTQGQFGFNDSAYSPYQPSPSPISEVQTKSLRGGCPLLGEHCGRCAEPPCPPPSAPTTNYGQFLDPGGSQNFPTTWWSPPPPSHGPFPANTFPPGPPNRNLSQGQVKASHQQSGWSAFSSSSPSTLFFQPASQLKQKTERKRQGAMAHLRGQRLKHRVTPKVEEDKSQEQKKSAKKTRK